MKQVTLTFKANSGECQIEAHGFSGQGCVAVTEYLQKALGEQQDFIRKQEWYNVNLQNNENLNSNLCG